MTSSGLTVLVVGYDDADIAITDFRDLVRVMEERELQDCEAAVIRKDASGHAVVASTVPAEERGTRLGACLGVVLGLAVSPAIAGVVVGGGFGALIGNVIDQAKGFTHSANLTEAERLIDDSDASLIAIADAPTSFEIAEAALRRDRRLIAEIDSADTAELERELQRQGLRWRY